MGNSQQSFFRRPHESSPIPESQPTADVASYSIGDVIGEGSYGAVLKARICANDHPVAIKIMDLSTDSGKKFKETFFEEELSLLRQLDHRFIIKTYEIFERRNKIYYVMQLGTKGDLLTYVLRRGHLWMRETREKTVLIADAVQYLHDTLGYVHHDLKCENIVMDRHNGLLLADFGLATKCKKGEMLDRGCGTSYYMCPELLAGELYNGCQNDVWSIGVIMYVMAVGIVPFVADSRGGILREIREEIVFPSYVSRRCQRCIRAVLNADSSQRLTLRELLTDSFMCPANAS